MKTCRRKVVIKGIDQYGCLGPYSYICGKTATREDDNGLPLCGRHHSKWWNKMQKLKAKRSQGRLR